MTLNTNIYVLGKFDYADFHLWVNTNLLGTENPVFTVKEPGVAYPNRWLEGGSETSDRYEFFNSPGQGLSAWFSLSGWDEPQDYAYEYQPEREDYDEEEDYQKALRQEEEDVKTLSGYYASMWFDTAYGYRGEEGMGCTELHALFIVRMYREYFEPRGIDIVWQDEYRGTLWKNLSEEGLTEFLGSGEDAMKWFNEVALPAFQSIARGTPVEE